MEYIEGSDISDFVQRKPEAINSIFEQTITGFKYLEELNILHRDIRESNILITNDGVVKIIDFGFGKKIIFSDDLDKSVSLNWWCEIPNEFSEKKYGKETEVYFVGKLFFNLLQQNNIEKFSYYSELKSMVELNPINRIKSFSSLETIIAEKNKLLDFFTQEEKDKYKQFANSLIKIISKIEDNTVYTKTDTI